jgi:hypothetical protein
MEKEKKMGLLGRIPTKINPTRVFILQKSELEKRLDPFYYIPEIDEVKTDLENARR